MLGHAPLQLLRGLGRGRDRALSPKDLYPELAFAWANYLYACGPCNGPKSNKFAVLVAGEVVPVVRAHGAPPTPPPGGRAALIDPRAEDPLALLFLDLKGELCFVPNPALPRASPDRARARYTIETLHLNDRVDLVSARSTTLRMLKLALIAAAASTSIVAAGVDVLADARVAVGSTPHRFVWDEMRRHASLGITPYRELFAAVADAADW
ncbi:MAG TPA: hypothetical protein VGM56_07015 [Byssovorax sp.]